MSGIRERHLATKFRELPLNQPAITIDRSAGNASSKAGEKGGVSTGTGAAAPVKCSTFGPGKLPNIIACLAVMAGIVLLASNLLGCSSVAKEDIAIEFAESLSRMSAVATEKVDAEVEDIAQKLVATEEKLLKLEQVVIPALEWVELQKDQAKTYGASFAAQVNAEGLDKLKNDQYQVTTLEGKGNTSGQFLPLMKVTDRITNSTLEWEKFDSELKSLRDTLTKRRQEKLEAQILSSQILLEIINHREDWQIEKLDDTTYSISGSYLGLADGPSNGKWTYHRDTGEIEPSDSKSTALKKVLTAEP